MSQSPTAAVESDAAPDYFEGLREWTRLVQRGASHSGRERNVAFLNVGGGEFAGVAAISGLNFLDDARAVVPTDWDGDGDLDLWLANRTGPQLRLMLNRLQSDSHWVAFRLEMREGNRDGIGARVEVRSGSQKLVRTLRAGEGFLSQTGKQLHFGLGAVDSIDEVVVHWPAGEAESFSGVAPDRVHRLRQGSGRARVVRTRPVEIESAPAGEEEIASGRRRLWLTGRPPMPGVAYTSLTGEARSVEFGSGPVLVNLWASWCAPCIEELGELGRRRDEIEQAGLRVVALSVDGLGDERSVTSDQLAETLRRLSFDRESGTAPADLVDRLELLHTHLFGRYVSLPVPVSFLVDRGGELAAIYFGATPVDELLADVSRLGSNSESNRSLGDPVAGRWLGAPPRLDLEALVAAYLDSGYVDDALPLLREELRRNPTVADAHYNFATALIRAGRHADAGPHLIDATRLDPQHAGAFGNLGLVLTRLGRLQPAAQAYARAVELAPDRAHLRLGYGRTLLRLGRVADAEGQLSEALSIAPSNVDAQYSLALLYERDGRHAVAVAAYEKVLRVRPEWPTALRSLAWLLATTPDDDLRDAARALALAEAANVATGGAVPEILDVLAVALAASGDFEQATQRAREAVRRFREAGRAAAADRAVSRLKLFEAGRDYRTIP